MKFRLVKPADDVRTKSGKRYSVPTYHTTGKVLKNTKDVIQIKNAVLGTIYKPHIRMK